MCIQFQFQLEGNHLNSSKWAFENGYIEGDFQIVLNDKVFFADTHINVVELAEQLGKWLQSIQHERMRDMVYESIDHDEPLLHFFIRASGVQLYSTWQKFELKELVPLNVVVDAVTNYLQALNKELYAIDYIVKLDRYLDENTSLNAKALMLFEQNEYDEAFKLLKQLAKEKRDVQSLNNLAWMYLREEEDAVVAKVLLEEVITFQPESPFPYIMLGEIALNQNHLEQAKLYLQTAITFGNVDEALYNLAIIHFKQGEFVASAELFAKVAGESDLTRLNEVVAWIRAGEQQKAKQMLDMWNEEAYDYTGATEIADVYIEMNLFSEARQQFEKDWHSGINGPYIVSRFGYTLMQLGDTDACNKMISQAITGKVNEIAAVQLEECDEHWTGVDKAERVEELISEKEVLISLYEKLEKGYIPAFEYDFYPTGGCQLFGCKQHGHDEYRNLSDFGKK